MKRMQKRRDGYAIKMALATALVNLITALVKLLGQLIER